MNPDLDLGLLRRTRVKPVRQTEIAECGLASLIMVANYHGHDIDLATARRRFSTSTRGATLKSLIELADQIGLTGRAVKLPLSGLRNLHLPAVLHWDMNHFVVIEAQRGERVLIHNPEGHSRWMPLGEVSDHFTGIALELRQADDFEPMRQRDRLGIWQLWRRMTGLKRAMTQTLVLSVVLQAFVLASPYYLQIAVDSALPALDRDLLGVLALGFGLFTLINGGATLLRSFVLLSAGTAVGYGISTNVARRLFRLPVTWFERRHVGDVLSRFQSIGPIRQFMTEGAVGSVLDGSLAVFTLAVMLFYSPALTAVATLAFVFYGAVRAVSYSAQRRAQEDAIACAGREQSTLIESLRGIVTLRLFNRETQRHATWQSRLTDSMNASVALSRVSAWQQAANATIFGIETVISVWLSIRLVIVGGFSVGMVFAYLAYKTQFLQRASSLVDQAVSFRMLGLHLERLSDIALAEQDRSFTVADVGDRPLTGRIELREVGFRYGPTEPWVLRGANLVVEPGEHIAITGGSGGGKSTLVKLILGLVEPEEGEVLIDGLPLASFGYKSYHEQVGAVLQDDHLFAGTLAENIAIFDDAPDLGRVTAAAGTAALMDDVNAMPMGLDTLVGDMGSTLSGGQRQRLLIARALYRNPRILVMDEGTSHLDSAKEQAVNAAVGHMGMTRVIIAHRLETIVSAERIYSVSKGEITDMSAQFAPIREQIRGRTDST